MKKLRRIVRYIILTAISWSGLYAYYRYRNRRRVLVMVYHDVVSDISEYDNHYNNNTSISKQRFSEEVKYICRHYNPITVEEFVNWKTNGGILPDNPVLFTFDDGHVNLYQNAIEVLNSYGIKGVFFIKSGCIGRTEQNYCEKFLSYSKSHEDGSKKYNLFRTRGYDEQCKLIDELCGSMLYDTVRDEKYGHFTTEQCLELISNGHSIQSHSVNHYILSSLDDSAAAYEIRQSKKDIESMFGCQVSSFAYPFGDPAYDFGKREEDMVMKAGYKLAFSGERKNVHGTDLVEDNFCISRFGDVNHDMPYFKLLLSPIRLKR